MKGADDMTEKKKPGLVTKLLDRIRQVNSELFAANAENTERLDYEKGNIDQNHLKNAGVWGNCPIMDERGNPIKETAETDQD
jgi:hypothetical protein